MVLLVICGIAFFSVYYLLLIKEDTSGNKALAATVAGGLVPMPCLVQLCYIALVPVPELSYLHYVLTSMAVAGVLLYGFAIPALLHHKLRAADKANILDTPDCLNRKPQKIDTLA